MTSATIDSRYPDFLQLRTPRGLAAALAVAAGRSHQTVSDFARQAILTKVEEAGVRLHGSGAIEILDLRAEE